MKTYGNVSAAHVSKTLSDAGYPRADEPRVAEVSGFVVSQESCGTWEGASPGMRVVTVGYQDYDYAGDYSNRARDLVGRLCQTAFDGYAARLRKAGYTVEDWKRYDGVRLGLFVMGRSS